MGEQEGVRGAESIHSCLVIVSSTRQPLWSRRAGAPPEFICLPQPSPARSDAEKALSLLGDIDPVPGPQSSRLAILPFPLFHVPQCSPGTKAASPAPEILSSAHTPWATTQLRVSIVCVSLDQEVGLPDLMIESLVQCPVPRQSLNSHL